MWTTDKGDGQRTANGEIDPDMRVLLGDWPISLQEGIQEDHRLVNNSWRFGPPQEGPAMLPHHQP